MAKQATQIEKPVAPQPLHANMKLAAYNFYEIIRACSAVAGYGKEPKEDREIIMHVSKKGLGLRMMDKSRELGLWLLTKGSLSFRKKSTV